MYILLKLQSNLRNLPKLSTNLKQLLFQNVKLTNQIKTKRCLTTETAQQQEKIADILSKKLAENKLNNILVYSCKASGSVALNSVGVFVCFLLIGASYNTFMLFDSIRFRSRKVDDDESFMGKALKLISSDRFKYSLCTVMVVLGIN